MTRSEIINPASRRDWDELVFSKQGCSFFHSSAWARTLQISYGYSPLYLALFDGDELKAALPLMEIKSLLTGSRGVSLPFSDYSGPLADTEDHLNRLHRLAMELGRKAGWKYLEIRNTRTLSAIPSYAVYLSHTVGISGDIKDICSKLRDSTRRNIIKAAKKGVDVTVSCSMKAVDEFYRLNCITRKNHGVPPQPLHFFKNIHEQIISKGLGFVSTAYFEDRPIAGAVYFTFGDKAYYKYGASDTGAQYLRPNDLVMWEAIKHLNMRGFKTLCLGRTEVENRGLQQFKEGWGGREGFIRYARYDFKSGAFLRGLNKTPGSAILRRMPSVILRGAGAILYRHMG